MRCLAVALTFTLASAAALAQTGEPRVGEASRRAPLADVDSLEPAVDVGGDPRITVARAPTAEEPGAAPPEAAPANRSTSAPAPPAAAPREAPPAPRVMDSLDLGTTSITGNQELPKVLYIVPWKKSDLGDLVGRPVNTLLDEVLTPVDPAVFERHLRYYDSLHGDSQ
jgi:hypothetical protein